MKRILSTASVMALALAISGTALAQAPTMDAKPSRPAGSETMAPIPGTGTAEVKGNKLIGADVKNTANEKIGDVDEVLVTTDGKVNAVIVSVGGFLGLGDRKVVMPWEQLRFSSEGSQLVVMTNATKESLKTLPEYQDPNRASSQQPARVPNGGAGSGSLGGTGMGGGVGGGGGDTSRPIRPAPSTTD